MLSSRREHGKGLSRPRKQAADVIRLEKCSNIFQIIFCLRIPFVLPTPKQLRPLYHSSGTRTVFAPQAADSSGYYTTSSVSVQSFPAAVSAENGILRSYAPSGISTGKAPVSGKALRTLRPPSEAVYAYLPPRSPSSITTIRSAPRTVDRQCAITKEVLPFIS